MSTITDRSTASHAEFLARMEPIARVEPDDDGFVATVARAIYNDGAYCGDCPYDGWDSCSDCRRFARGYALAAIDAIKDPVR